MKSEGIGFLGALALVFIVLKLTEVITWSWLWVLAPLWGPLAISLVIFGGGLVIAVFGFVAWFIVSLFKRN